MHNPFVYGEVVPAAAFVDRVDELDRLVADLAPGRRSSSSHRAATASRRSSGRRSPRSRATACVTVEVDRQQLQLVRRVSRGVRPCASLAAEAGAERARFWLREAIRSARAESGRGGRARGRLLSGRAYRARRFAARAGGLRAAGARRGTARRARSSSRSTSSRRSPGSTADRSSTRCARPFSTSATSGTCSPAPSQA